LLESEPSESEPSESEPSESEPHWVMALAPTLRLRLHNTAEKFINCYILCRFLIPNHVYSHCRSRSRWSQSRIALQLRLCSNDAAPAPQHCSYVYVNITTNFIPCKSVGDEKNNISNLLKNRQNYQTLLSGKNTDFRRHIPL
jgi:hypothetical protein